MDHRSEGPSFCADYVELRNGVDEFDPLILNECQTKPNARTLVGSSVWIKFKSDWKYERKGFSLKITKLAQSEGKSNYEIAIKLI